jgi:hypothetical protein
MCVPAELVAERAVNAMLDAADEASTECRAVVRAAAAVGALSYAIGMSDRKKQTAAKILVAFAEILEKNDIAGFESLVEIAGDDGQEIETPTRN